MTCEHRFLPFPGSRAKVYCEYCGVGRDAFAKAEPSPRRASSRRPMSGGQTEAPQVRLPFADPDVEDARAIVEAKKSLEDRVRAIVESSNLDPDEAESVMREALDFGDHLDLDHFASTLSKMPPRQATLVPEDVA